MMPAAPSGFSVADSIDRIRAAQVAAQRAQRDQSLQADELAGAILDTEEQQAWDQGMKGMRQFPSMQANGIRGPWDQAKPDPMTMGVNSQVAREDGLPSHIDKDYDPWRDPGAMTVPQAHAKHAADVRRNAEDQEAQDYDQWSKGYEQDRKDEATQREMESLAAGVQMQHPADPVVPADKLDRAGNAAASAAAMKSLERTGPSIEEKAPVAPTRGFAGNDRAGMAAARRKGERYSEPSEAPLPGEETLPPGVAAWNHDRAQSGQAGLGELRRAYDIEQATEPTGQDFAAWLESHGLKADTHPVKAGEILDRILSDNLARFPNHDPRGDVGGDDARINKDDDTVLQGRRGLADDTDTHLMSPEQRRMVGSHQDGTPRSARGGQFVWDQSAADGKGAYVPRGYDKGLADQAMREGNIRKEAMAYGIDHRAYGDNEAQLRADVGAARKRFQKLGQNYDMAQVEGGGTRLTPNAKSQERTRQMKENQFVSTMGKRFAQEFAQRGVAPGQIGQAIRDAYREGLKLNSNADDPHLAAIQHVNEHLLDGVRNQREATLQLAVNQRADQNNRAQAFGMPVGMVRALDTLGSARSPQEQVNALSVLHATAPMMGFDRMAAMLLRGQVESSQLAQWAQMNGAKPNGMAALDKDLGDVQGGPVGADTVVKAHAIAQRAAGQNATPDQVIAQRNMILQPKASEIAQRDKASPEEINMIRQVTDGMSAVEFYRYLGLDPNDPRSWRKYEDITKRPARSIWQRGYDTVVGVGGAVGQGLSSGLSAIQSATPDTAAWAGQQEEPFRP
jgi:hypothetical protein